MLLDSSSPAISRNRPLKSPLAANHAVNTKKRPAFKHGQIQKQKRLIRRSSMPRYVYGCRSPRTRSVVTEKAKIQKLLYYYSRRFGLVGNVIASDSRSANCSYNLPATQRGDRVKSVLSAQNSAKSGIPRPHIQRNVFVEFRQQSWSRLLCRGELSAFAPVTPRFGNAFLRCAEVPDVDASLCTTSRMFAGHVSFI